MSKIVGIIAAIMVIIALVAFLCFHQELCWGIAFGTLIRRAFGGG